MFFSHSENSFKWTCSHHQKPSVHCGGVQRHWEVPAILQVGPSSQGFQGRTTAGRRRWSPMNWVKSYKIMKIWVFHQQKSSSKFQHHLVLPDIFEIDRNSQLLNLRMRSVFHLDLVLKSDWILGGPVPLTEPKIAVLLPCHTQGGMDVPQGKVCDPTCRLVKQWTKMTFLCRWWCKKSTFCRSNSQKKTQLNPLQTIQNMFGHIWFYWRMRPGDVSQFLTYI